MATHVRQYEAMFLLNAGYASGNWDAAKAEVEHILHRANAEILHLRKWDERRLAYAIKGNKRGVYVLAFFKAEGPKIAGIERDAQLSENILRVLVIKAEHLALKDVEAMVPQQPIVEDHFGRSTSRRPDRDRTNSVEPVVDAIEGTVTVVDIADGK